MTLLSRSDASVFHLPGVQFTTLSAPSRGASENAVWEVTLAPGANGAPHRLTREETFIALQGSAIAEVEGQRHEVNAGDVLLVQPGKNFSLSNTGSLPFRALAVFPVGGQVEIDDRSPFTPPWAS
jgi:quercetin dioxygenase-like cupin family protein